MRIISLDRVREGMILGRTIYGPNNEAFLRRGMVIKNAYISSLRRLNYNSIYIEDVFSQDVDIAEAVTGEQRNAAERSVKNVFKQSLSSTQTRLQFSGFAEAINNMVDQIIANDGTVDNLTALKTYDEYTFQHSVNTCIISVVLGSKLDYGRNELRNLGMAAALHDIGKVSVPYEIINKSSSLNNDEFDFIKQHPRLGKEIINENKIFPPEVSIAVDQHHERIDGSGYGRGLKGDEIHIYAKIIALADVYDAITSKRSYKDAMQTFEAYEFIMANLGTQFDSFVASLFLKCIAPFPVGSCVRLSSGEIGVVIKNNPNLMMRPCVRIADSKKELDLSDPTQSLTITITEVIG